MIRMLIFLYGLVVLAHGVITWIRIPSNRWTELIRSVVEPSLQVTRRLMKRYLPFMTGKGVDWSPLMLLVALIVIRRVLGLSWLV